MKEVYLDKALEFNLSDFQTKDTDSKLFDYELQDKIMRAMPDFYGTYTINMHNDKVYVTKMDAPGYSGYNDLVRQYRNVADDYFAELQSENKPRGYYEDIVNDIAAKRFVYADTLGEFIQEEYLNEGKNCK